MTELSVCIINKDNAQKLQKCLQAVKDGFGNHFNNIDLVITDTGSSDNSVEIARQYTNNISFFKWNDDFSAARNYCIEKAACDRIIVLDSDEYLKYVSDEDYRTLIENMDKYPYARGRLERYSDYYEDDRRMQYAEQITRIFNRKYFHYSGRIHEQLIIKPDVKTDSEPDTVWDAPLRADHDGYQLSLEDFQKKADRNRRLLISSIEIEPQDPYLYYQLGRTEYVSHNYNEAYDYLNRSLNLISTDEYNKSDYIEDALTTLCYSAIKIQKAPQAADALIKFENLVPSLRLSADFTFAKGLILMNCAKFDEAVDTFINATRQKKSHVVGTNSFMAWYNAGVICEITGSIKRAEEFYNKCGNYKPALEGIKRLSEK